ncbi:MAG TPA: amino acid adenylation domain-containing protein [Pyrinomonadaceae bacterium]|nr:amino acid adenylation domain-containing protein [Pyrinomonadaceae bacterium]
MAEQNLKDIGANPRSDGRRKTFSAMIIGSGTLAIQCAEILINLHHRLVAFASSDVSVSRWAAKKGVPCYAPNDTLTERITEPIDYLFSIVNDQILSDDILQIPKKFAINYHDALLPRYAGTHATSWAIINGETQHGVTWHCVAERVDAGDILEQQLVEIAAGDTAFTLNTKCFEAAIRSFGVLVDSLAGESYVRTRQDLAERTFFPRFKRLPNGGLIDWNTSADKISAIVRGLSFGRHPNPLGTPKVDIAGEYFIVSKVEILDERSSLPAGVICGIGDTNLDVSTADKNLRLTEIHSLTGPVVDLAELVKRLGLKIGQPLSPTCQLLDAHFISAFKAEAALVHKLHAIEPAPAPLASNIGPGTDASFGSIEFRVPEEFAAYSHQKKADISLADAVSSAFGVLLARLSGNFNFLVGFDSSSITPKIANENRLFATNLPFHFDIDAREGFNTLLDSTMRELESIRAVPFYLAEIFSRYPQIRPLAADMLFNGLPVTLAMNVDPPEYHPTPANALSMLISDNGEGHWVYNTAMIRPDEVLRLDRYFNSLLQAIVTDPERAVAKLPLLPPDERKQQLAEWNSTSRAFPQDLCVHRLVSETAGRFPDKKAVVSDVGELTYAELDRRSDRLACRLNALGVQPESVVAVFMERSVDMVTALLGILKSGAAYVPFDPAQPKERLDFMIGDCGARVLITQEHLRERLQQTKCEVISTESILDIPLNKESHNFVPLARPNNLAYVIYTSGSTGEPKGVEIEHRSLMNLVAWHQRTYKISSEDRATMLAGPAFDASVWELWPYLCTGSCIYVPDDDTRRTPSKLLRYFSDNSISIAFASTPLAEALLTTAIPADLRLRTLLTGGDRLHALGGKPMSFDLINHYGPTENTVVTTCGPVDPESYEPPTIGRPIDNTEVFILDQDLQPVPIGIPGEIFIGGVGLARGYRDRPELTASRFINPDIEGRGRLRLYRTGDRGKYLHDGRIAFIDRIDEQVKVRGFRIEMGEIETAIVGHPEISEAVVNAVKDKSGSQRLAAYYVANAGGSVKVSSLRSYLKAKLPDYMIPTAFVELDLLPITPNGKVDRKALPAPNLLTFPPSRKLEAPRNDVESTLKDIWERLLGIGPIGVTDNFFELGGDSLISVSLFVEIEAAFSIDLPLSTLINAPTIEQLARFICEEERKVAWKYIVPLKTSGTKTPIFLVHAAGGNVLFYRDLANEMGANQPIYGLQARGVADKSETAHDRVEDMATDYLDEMRKLQPVGPYRVCGSSFGGLVAFEIAVQLERRGEKVETLGLFDTYAPGYLDESTIAGGAGSRRFIAHMRSLIGQLREIKSTKERAYFVISKGQKVKNILKRKVIWKKNQFAIEYNKATGRELPVNVMRNHEAIQRALDAYRPGRYAGDITVFRASEQPKNTRFDPSLGWAELVDGNVVTEVVKGSHGALTVHPYAADLAAKFEEVESRNDALSLDIARGAAA